MDVSMVRLPSLRQLGHLVALAEHRHFGRAAQACGVTQSSLSASIKELERGLEAVLVDRTKRRMVLTPLGAEIVERARRLLREADDLVGIARAAREPLCGTVRMGVIPTIGPFLLPAILPSLRRAYPKLRLYLVEDLTARLIERLHGGELDTVLLALPYDRGNVEQQILFQDPFLLAVPQNHPFARRAAVRPEALAAEGLLLLKEGHCLREHALTACRLADPSQVEPVEATSLATLVQMVDNGLGITLLPQLAIAGGILRGTSLSTLPFSGAPPCREIGLVWRRGTGRREEFALLATALGRLAAETLGAGRRA